MISRDKRGSADRTDQLPNVGKLDIKGRTHGHNIFIYHHPMQPGAPILCDFGVEITRAFEAAGEVYATETPGGEAAVAVHRGPYGRMNETHEAMRKWMAANRRESAGLSWKIWGIRHRIRATRRLRLCAS